MNAPDLKKPRFGSHDVELMSRFDQVIPSGDMPSSRTADSPSDIASRSRSWSSITGKRRTCASLIFVAASSTSSSIRAQTMSSVMSSRTGVSGP